MIYTVFKCNIETNKLSMFTNILRYVSNTKSHFGLEFFILTINILCACNNIQTLKVDTMIAINRKIQIHNSCYIN